MADPKTDINESLCCIALGFIREFSSGTPEQFKEMVMIDEDKKWTNCIKNLEVTTKDREVYAEAFKNKDEWIYGSYFSAKKIKDILNVNLEKYIISRVEKKLDNKSYHLKEVAGSAIKNWAKIYAKTNKTWSPGLLSNLNADKINISDIMLIDIDSKMYKILDKIISVTNGITWDEIEKNPSKISDVLTPKLYTELFNRAWKRGEIYGISLKKVTIIPDAQGKFPQNPNVPTKILNVDVNASANLNNYTDEVAFLISSLVAAAKNAKGFNEFKNMIKDTIELEPVEFLSKDRLDVKYKFKVPSSLKSSTKNKYSYVCWTNFGGGTNSVYFQEEGSGSASGEGGITLSYFHTLVKEIPGLRRFVKDLKDKREKYFKASCEEYEIDFTHINNQLGSSALTSGVYNDILYKSLDFKKLVHVLLTQKLPENDSQLIFPETYKAFKNQTGEGVNLTYTIEKDKKTIQEKLKLKNTREIDCLEHFFKTYINFLSKDNNKMGKYFGESTKTLKAIETQNNNIKKEQENKFNALVLKKQLEILSEEQKKLKPKERIRGKDATETKILKQQAAKTFKLAKDIMDSFKKEAKIYAEKKRKDIEITYKKSFALLANAEFGYMYSQHAEKINELVKKQVLLSLYAAASGRGYIIFNRKRFKIEDYFEKDAKGAPFLKIGK